MATRDAVGVSPLSPLCSRKCLAEQLHGNRFAWAHHRANNLFHFRLLRSLQLLCKSTFRNDWARKLCRSRKPNME